MSDEERHSKLEDPLLRVEVFKLLRSGIDQRTVAEIVGSNQTAISRMFGKRVKKFIG